MQFLIYLMSCYIIIIIIIIIIMQNISTHTREVASVHANVRRVRLHFVILFGQLFKFFLSWQPSAKILDNVIM